MLTRLKALPLPPYVKLLLRHTFFGLRPVSRKQDNQVDQQGKSDQQGSQDSAALGLLTLNSNAPKPRPPLEMTSPNYIEARQSLDPEEQLKLTLRAFWVKSDREKRIERELKLAGIPDVEARTFKAGRPNVTSLDVHVYAYNRRNSQPTNKWETIAKQHGVTPKPPSYKNPVLAPRPAVVTPTYVPSFPPRLVRS